MEGITVLWILTPTHTGICIITTMIMVQNYSITTYSSLMVANQRKKEGQREGKREGGNNQEETSRTQKQEGSQKCLHGESGRIMNCGQWDGRLRLMVIWILKLLCGHRLLKSEDISVNICLECNVQDYEFSSEYSFTC